MSGRRLNRLRRVRYGASRNVRSLDPLREIHSVFSVVTASGKTKTESPVETRVVVNAIAAVNVFHVPRSDVDSDDVRRTESPVHVRTLFDKAYVEENGAKPGIDVELCPQVFRAFVATVANLMLYWLKATDPNRRRAQNRDAADIKTESSDGSQKV